MKYVDGIKPRPTNNWEAFAYFMNHQTSLLVSGSIFSKKIKVTFE